jgi:4-hydroxybenzoate polyprenyltransferase
MRLRVRVLCASIRPPVLVLMSLFAATGLAEAGGDPSASLAPALVVIVAFVLFSVVLFSVTLNDLADEEIDPVNLSGDRRRPLVSGACNRRQLSVLAVTGGFVALAGSALIGASALVVTVVGLVVGAAYSLRPFRISGRGVLAPMLLPACYVGVPYLLGVLTVRSSVSGQDVILLVGLYLGFVGRIVLKDFRDVRGDALFGKRTFLIRHGRVATCRVSALCWTAGGIFVASDESGGPRLAGAALIFTALVLLRALTADWGPRRDESLISALAILGRGTIVALVADLSMRQRGEGCRSKSALRASCLLTAGWGVRRRRRV